ncbi:MAG: NAD-dependent epimerase/dehydratase family protein [Bryobacterales bacterium]|nr:NAD-dependent epimerase/dehydratase family protein [Bryobacterales bacterium]
MARMLLAKGHSVLATHRTELDSANPETVSEFCRRVSAGTSILHSVPLVRNGHDWLPPTEALAPLLERAARIVYLSTTGVYGAQPYVDENTLPAPRAARETMRVDEERRVRELCPSTLILRPTAIYGPGRGVQVSLRNGTHRLWGDGTNYISRIYVDDLAALCAAALQSTLGGAYPVADEAPCEAREITQFCASALGIAAPAPLGRLPEDDTRSANRQVDGRAICRLLGVELQHRSYKTGIIAAIEAEKT